MELSRLAQRAGELIRLYCKHGEPVPMKKIKDRLRAEGFSESAIQAYFFANF